MPYLQLARRWQGYGACVRNHFLLKLQLVTKLSAVEALAPRSNPQSFRIPLSPYHLAAKSQTIMFAMLQAEGIAITSAFLLLFLVCVVALIQSRLIKAAGHWQQHRASMFQARDHTLLSRTNTTAAELFTCVIYDRAQRQQWETRVATLAQAPLSKYPAQAS